MKKAYVCNRFPGYSIRNQVQFQSGRFITEDESLQELVESNDWYGIHIHPEDLPEKSSKAPPAKKAQASTPANSEASRVRAGAIGSKPSGGDIG